MKHTDEEKLALMALGELPSDSGDLHLQTCLACRSELEALRSVVTAARVPEPEDIGLLQPPAELWTEIATELALGQAPDGAVDAVGEGRHAVTADKEGRIGSAAEHSAPASRAARRPLLSRRARFSVVLAVCAALLGATAGSVVTWWVTRGDSTAAVAHTRALDSLRPSSTGYASLRGTGAHRSLTIQVKGLPTTPGYFEVWLMDRSHTKLVSVGVLAPDGKATLPVPENIDLREYSIVDVSVQPYNGKPDHSGKSIVRGRYAG
ncbi:MULTISPECIES: anti-sigma factor [unclassified Streptomyces]|uniref:anti-sigma factor n=1 Tax=unclassified Streptomyces TaxID=2593676 RepID=UPI00367763E0